MKLKTYHRFAAQLGSENTLNANGVYALLPDAGGRLWVGTESGLALMDCDKGAFEHIHNMMRNHSDPWISGMADDGQGRLWIASQQGAFCFAKPTRSFRILTPPAPIPSGSVRAVMLDPQTHTVTFGGANGFFSFPINDPPPASAPPSVVLTSFKVFDKDYPLDGDISTLTSITLPHSASFFSFTFAVLDFIDPGKNQYAYRLEGIDPEWIQAGTRRYVSYTNLDPGKYIFSVRGSNSEGIWSDKAATLEIIVLLPGTVPPGRT